jgi:hypothetical protein
MKCLTQDQFRREVRRLTSTIREHVTMFPVVVILLDFDGEIEAIHHVPPLWVFPRKYTSTKSAESALDPANQRPDLNRLNFTKSTGSRFSKSPPGIPAPKEFRRYVSASESGNVNSVMMLNFWSGVVIPFLRNLGVTSEDTVITNWDRHSSHESQDLLELQQRENVSPAFFPAHATNWLQFHDADRGPFQVLKTEGRKDIDAWTIHLHRRRNPALCLEDFPFVVQRPYRLSIKDEVTKRSLKAIGLIPFNPDEVLSKMPGSNKLYAEYKFDDEDGGDVKNGAGDGGGSQSDSQVSADLFFQTASQPQSNRSPKRRPGMPRFRQDPRSVTISGGFDLFDPYAQGQQTEIIALAQQMALQPSSVTKPRGITMGNPGDVFLARDVTIKRDAVTKAREEKVTAKRKRTTKKRDMITKLRSDLKKAKKAKTTSNKKLKAKHEKQKARSKKSLKRAQAELQKAKDEQKKLRTKQKKLRTKLKKVETENRLLKQAANQKKRARHDAADDDHDLEENSAEASCSPFSGSDEDAVDEDDNNEEDDDAEEEDDDDAEEEDDDDEEEEDDDEEEEGDDEEEVEEEDDDEEQEYYDAERLVDVWTAIRNGDDG